MSSGGKFLIYAGLYRVYQTVSEYEDQKHHKGPDRLTTHTRGGGGGATHEGGGGRQHFSRKNLLFCQDGIARHSIVKYNEAIL